MGKPIVYCQGCGKSLRDADFNQGNAATVKNRHLCRKCLPPDWSPPKASPASSSRNIPLAARTSRPAGRPVAPPRRAAPSPLRWILLGAGGAGLLLLLVVLIAAPSGSAPVAPRYRPEVSAPVARPAPPPPKDASPAEALAEQARIEKEMTRKTEQEKRAQVFRFMMQIKEMIPETAANSERRTEALRMLGVVEEELGGPTPETTQLREEIKRIGTDGGARPYLVGHWRFDEISGTQAADASESETHGTLVGSASWGTGRIGGGVALKGGGHVKIPALGVLGDLQLRKYSITVWFRPEGTPVNVDGQKNTGSYAILIRRGAHLGLRYTAERTIEASHWLDGDGWQAARSPRAYAPGRFVHLASTVDPDAGELRLYVDGTEVSVKTWPKGTSARDYGKTDWMVGVNQAGSPKWHWSCEGTVDDLRLYSTALTSEQVHAIYRSAP